MARILLEPFAISYQLFAAAKEATMRRTIMTLLTLIARVVLATAVSAKSFFKVGEEAPSFTLTSITGEAVSLASVQGDASGLGLVQIRVACVSQGTDLQ